MSHFYVFGYEAYIFFPSKFHTNQLVLCSKLMIFIGYEDNGYCFICYIQENITFHSTHAIFDEEPLSKCTNSLLKEHKLYDKLLDKIRQSYQCLILLEKMNLLQYLFYTYLFPPFKMILLLILLHLLFLISFHLPHLPQSLKSLQQKLKRMTMLTLMLRCNHSALNNLYNLFCRHHKKVLN